MSKLQQRFTRESYDRLKKELENLKAQRGKIAEDIRDAREQGDLRENFGYHAARDEQGLLEARITLLESRLADAVIVDSAETQNEVVFGVPATVRDVSTGSERTYTIVTDEELDEVDGGATPESPIGSVLLGRHVGDTVEVQGPNGVIKFEVVAVGAK